MGQFLMRGCLHRIRVTPNSGNYLGVLSNIRIIIPTNSTTLNRIMEIKISKFNQFKEKY